MCPCVIIPSNIFVIFPLFFCLWFSLPVLFSVMNFLWVCDQSSFFVFLGLCPSAIFVPRPSSVLGRSLYLPSSWSFLPPDPSSTVLSNEFPLSMWPIQFLCLSQIVSISNLCSPTIVSTWSFHPADLFYRQIHVSNASSLLMSSFLRVTTAQPN